MKWDFSQVFRGNEPYATMLPVHVCFKFDDSIADSRMVIFSYASWKYAGSRGKRH